MTGANGSGKSTLMKTIAGLMEADSGKIICSDKVKTAYLPQFGIVHRGHTLLEEVHEAFSELNKLALEAEEITEQLEKNDSNQEALLRRYQKISDILDDAEWDKKANRVEQVLTGLGFKQKDFESDVAAFSGGWQMRIALSKILLLAPDILLLDEPTNYLDLEAREWLRDFIQQYSGGVMLVSHDRRFLDETCRQVAEIFMSRVRMYKSTFSEYEDLKKKETVILLKKWKQQQEEIARIESFINRFRYKKSKAAQVQSRVKMLAELKRITIPAAMKRMRLKFPKVPYSGKNVLRCENLSYQYDENTVFSELNLELPRGSKTAVVGVNGAGKSTFLRIVSGNDTGYSGSLQFGNGVKIGYFSQDQDAVLDSSLTVLDEAARDSREDKNHLRNLLGSFLFSGDDIDKKVGILSGGEKNRLSLLKLLLEPVNLLVLDEPTNHLDITSKDILLNALSDFGGTLVIVSHDKYFLEHIADRVLEIRDGRGKLFLGDYSYYRWRIEENPSPHEKQNSGRKNKSTTSSYEDMKKRKAELSRLRKEEKNIASELEEMELSNSNLHFELEKPENYSDPVKAHNLSLKIKDVEERIERTSVRWEEVTESLEKMEMNSGH